MVKRTKGRKGRRKQGAQTPSSGQGEEGGWESEVRTREEEVAEYEERILVREFKERLAFNIGKVRHLHEPLDPNGRLCREAVPWKGRTTASATRMQ
jgi:hypothetical protein